MGTEANTRATRARGNSSKLARQVVTDQSAGCEGRSSLNTECRVGEQRPDAWVETLILGFLDPPDCLAKELHVKKSYIPRVRGKVAYIRRKQGGSGGDSMAGLVRYVCKQTLGERSGQYLVPSLPIDRGTAVEEVAGRVARKEPDETREAHTLYGDFKSTILSEHAGVYPILAAFEQDRDNVEHTRGKNGKFDAGKIARTLGCPWSEARELAPYLNAAVERFRKKLAKMNQLLPRPFRKLHDRLKKLASESLRTLPPVELRRELFDLSRSLVACFDREILVGHGVRRLHASQFDDTVDLLLDEHKCRVPGDERPILERLMQASVHIREALEEGDINRAFAHIPMFVLDSARMQLPKGPARPQILLAYTYTLRLTAQYDEYICASQAIAGACDAVAESKGGQALDGRPEFEHGDTLRRVKTKAMLNELVVLFYFRFTTAADKRFMVKNYEGLASLPGRMEELLRADARAEAVTGELLVVQTHLARAAYNAHRMAKGKAEKERRKVERDRRRSELRAVMRTHFFDAESGCPDSRRLVEAVSDVGEGAAVDRTLDIIEDLFGRQKDVVAAIRAERKAAMSAPKEL